ncbi:MAG: hypothetical protein AAB919_00080 [Patescibacteria group bacterium]
MSKEMTIIALGLWIIVLPYLGIPGDWRVVLLVLSGIGIAVTGFLLRGEAISRGTRPRAHDSYVESSQPMHVHEEYKEGITSLN